jgi:hypothetical protein
MGARRAGTLEFSPNLIGFFAEVIASSSAHTDSNRIGCGAI